MSVKKVFSMFPWSSNRGKRTSSICSVGSSDKVRAGGAITGVEVGGGGMSELELLWLEAINGAQKRDSTFSTIYDFVRSSWMLSSWVSNWAGKVPPFLLLWRKIASSLLLVSSLSRTTMVGPIRFLLFEASPKPQPWRYIFFLVFSP